MNKILIYGLNCPLTGKTKYIGKTKRTLQYRLSCHCNDLRSNCHKNNWIKKLAKQGLKPIIEEIDVVPESEWEFWEQYWISQFKAWGFKLKNNSVGGDGPVGTKHSGKALINIQNARKKRMIYERENGLTKGPFVNKTQQEKREIFDKARSTRLKNGGYIVSDERRKKVSMIHKGKKLTSEHKRKLSQIKTGKPVSDHTRKKCIEVKSKCLLQIDLKGNVVKEWFNVPTASKSLNINKSSIRRALYKKSVYKGFTWSYK